MPEAKGQMKFTVSDIIIYPVKSLGGISLQSSAAETEGLRYDRKWMLVDANNRFLSQREVHGMCLLKMSFAEHEEGFMISHAQQQDTFFLPFNLHTDEVLDVTIWDDTVKANVVSHEADEWFSRVLATTCRLVKHTTATQRNVNPQYAHNGEQTGFCDAYPVLIIGESALADLNSRLEEHVPMERFRPNIVFSGGAAFAEDTWKELTIGNTGLRVLKPCARCVITTIDQQTGIAGQEPLKTLASYRTVDKKVMFGQNVLITSAGTIRIGDLIQLTPSHS